MRALGLGLLLLVLAPSVAGAQSVHLGRIRGPGGARVRSELEAALRESGVTVAPDAPATVSGRLVRRRRGYRLRLRLSQGAVAERFQVQSRRRSELVRSALARIRYRLRDDRVAIEPVVIGAASEDRAVPERSPAPSASPAAPRPRDWAGEDALELSAGLDWMARSLGFTDDLFDRVGEYELAGAPVVTVSARWFPAHHWTSHPLAGFGVEGQAFGALGVSSATADGNASFATTIDSWRAGLVYRVRVAEPVRVEGMVGGGEARFRVEPTGPRNPSSIADPIPAAHYRYLRPALAGHVELGAGFSVRAAVGWRAVLSSGQLGHEGWFPRSFTTGMDLSLEVRWRFDRWFALRAHASYERYVSDLRPEVGDVRVAGGAGDEWIRAGADLIVILPGAR